MSRPNQNQNSLPGKSENTKVVQMAARKAKLAKALKANIKRRKASAQDPTTP